MDEKKNIEIQIDEKIDKLQRVINSKDEQIAFLESRIMLLEKDRPVDMDNLNVEDSDESDSKEDYSVENESVDSDFETKDPASDEEDIMDVKVGIEEQYRCEKCDFTTIKRVGLSIHRAKKHKHYCAGCANDFSEPIELKRHFCEKVENLENPSYDSYFIEKRKQASQCFIVIKNKFKLETPISILHTEDCWSNPSNSCSDLNLNPAPTSKDSADLDIEGMLHMLVTSVISNRLVDWDELFRCFVGSGVD